MNQQDSAKKDFLAKFRHYSVLQTVFVFQVIAIMIVALIVSHFFIHGFNQDRVPAIIQEQKVGINQQLLFLESTMEINPNSIAEEIELSAESLGRLDLIRPPAKDEVFLFKDGDGVKKVYLDAEAGSFKTAIWQPDIRMYDEARGAVYLATDTGQLLFSNVKLDDFLLREPVKEFFDSGLTEGMRLYQSDETDMVSGFTKVEGSNTILFIENPLYGVKSKVLSFTKVVVLGGLVAGLLVAILSYLLLSNLAAPFKEAKEQARRLAAGEENPEPHFLDSPDFGGLIKSIQSSEVRMRYFTNEYQDLMANLRSLQTGLDRIRSRTSLVGVLTSWVSLLEKSFKLEFHAADFYKIKEMGASIALCCRIKDAKPNMKDQIQAQDDTRQSILSFRPDTTGSLEEVDDPHIYDSILLLLREPQIAEKNGFQYIVGHQAKWVLSIRPLPDLSSKPGAFLCLSVLASALDIKIQALTEHEEEIQLTEHEGRAS